MTTTVTSPTSGIEVSLSNQDQWEKFHPMTEMVVTRKVGRQLFPHLKYNLKGLDPDAKYELSLHFERVDNIKYKFSANKWEEFSKGEEIRPIELKMHKDGSRNGGYWMENPVSFEHIKITNNPGMEKWEHTALVQSMHKYMPVLSIQKEKEEKEEFRFAVTEFMAVTAYQNKDIVGLKVEMNRFASGFKKTGGHNKSPNSDSGSSPRGAKRQSTSPEVLTPPSAPWTPPYNPLTPLSYNNTPVTPMSQTANTFSGYQYGAFGNIPYNKENGAEQFPMNQFPMYQWQMPMGMYPMVPPMNSGMVPSMGAGMAPMNSSLPPVADVSQNPQAMQQYMSMPMNNMGQWNMGNGNGMENRMPQSELPNYTF